MILAQNSTYLLVTGIVLVIMFLQSPLYAIGTLVVVVASVFFFMRISKQLKESEERWKFALEGSGDGVWDWNVPADEVVYSRQYKEMHGFTDGDVSANIPAWQQRIHPDDREHVKKDIYACLDGKTPNYVNEHRIVCKNGKIKWVLARGMVVKRDEQGRAIRMIGTHADITERKLMEEQIRQMAQYDALTNLPNRSLFNDRLQLAIAAARRDQLSMAVMFIDLDGFKPINDKYGHNIGDLLLKEVSARLTVAVRASDSVARIGGDEFVVLLPNIQNAEDAQTVADKIQHTLTQPFRIFKREMYVSGSIGVAIYPEHATDEKLLLINADMAMYAVKQDGGRGCAFYAPDMRTIASLGEAA